MNFRQVRRKIKTISNVKKITKAMQMVAAVKMRRAQLAALEGKLYRQTLDAMMREVLSRVDISLITEIPLLSTNSSTKTLCMLVSSNKGLCGGFNMNVIKFLLNNVDFKNCDFVTIGRKGSEFVRRMGGNIINDFSDPDEDTDVVSAVFKVLEDTYLEGVYGTVQIVYNDFISSLKYTPTKAQLLPIRSDEELHIEKKQSEEVFTDYLIDPEPATILPTLIRDVLHEKIRSALLDSDAAEQSARMMAMKQATDSASDLIVGLTSLSNKLRQQSITYELLDIISAQAGAQ